MIYHEYYRKLDDTINGVIVAKKLSIGEEELFNIGVSKCHKDDIFDFSIGYNLALYRACNPYFKYKLSIDKDEVYWFIVSLWNFNVELRWKYGNIPILSPNLDIIL